MSTPEPRTVAIWQHATRSDAATTASEFAAALVAQGLRVAAPSEDLPLFAPELDVAPLAPEPVELCVIFGGDGSILRAAEWALPRQVPLLGVNLGHIGFLAELDRSEQGDLVDAVVQRRYSIEARRTLAVEARDPSGAIVWSSVAVNEVSVEKSARERMVEVLVRIDGLPLSRWGCDGVLVSTPTGSTAYAFSAGGPVVWPDVDAMLIVPVSAHALFSRPVVVSPQSTIEVELVEPSATEGVVWCDGRRSTPLHGGTHIVVGAGEHSLLLARLTEQPFTSRLQRKFGLRVTGWRGAAEGETDAAGHHAH